MIRSGADTIGQSRGGASPKRGSKETFTIEIKKVAVIRFHDLLLFSKGQGPESDECLHAMTCLSTVLHHLPAMTYTPVGSNFFTPSDKTTISGGVEVWRGYHQV